ncbi:hypothetical protein TIFTF001_027087 [Ficus carica]|uniref:Uncharacterized protein n=1 Tax=Ficus carica TaxID=3494 RepID=A0AA88DMD8_FICCA|nr:hypothetical protein TIFTF001_027087 [Ficus carica]
MEKAPPPANLPPSRPAPPPPPPATSQHPPALDPQPRPSEIAFSQAAHHPSSPTGAISNLGSPPDHPSPIHDLGLATPLRSPTHESPPQTKSSLARHATSGKKSPLARNLQREAPPPAISNKCNLR